MKNGNFPRPAETNSRHFNPRRILAIATMCLFLTPAVLAASGTVYFNNNLQQIEGFGAAIYDGSYELTTRSYRNTVYDYMFRDLGIDVVRLRNCYTFDSGYLSATGTVIKEANDRSVAMGRPLVKIEMVPWSPPASLKSNNNVNGGGTLKGGPSAYDYAGLANWWANSLTASNGWGSVGIHPDYISIQNEPDIETSYDSCRYDITEDSSYAGYNLAFEAVWQEVYSRMGSSMPKMIGPESTGYAGGAYNYPPRGAMDYIDNFINLDHCYAYSFHLYSSGDGGSEGWENPDSHLPDMAAFVADYSDKPLINTEYVHLNDTPSFDDAWKLAWHIHNGFYHLNLASYYHWTFIRAVGTGGLINITSTSSYIVRDMYWYFKHFAYFTDPGWYVVDVTTNPSDNMRMSAFKNAANNKLTVVILNKSATAETLTLTLNGCTQTSSAVYRSSETEHWASLGTFSNPVSLPAYSIVTIAFDVTGGPTNSLTCSSTANGDVTTPGEGAFQYTPGSYAAIVATPDATCHFVNWTGTAASAGKVGNVNNASTNVLMDASYTVVANFAADTTPPNPNPMTWEMVPTKTAPYSISMTASPASDSDNPPVQYYFECTNDASKSSTWQTGTTYGVSGLTPSTQYSFRVKARDSSSNQNETGWSSTESATTNPPETNPPTPNPSTWATVPTATGATMITMTADTATDTESPPVQYYFECTTDAGKSSSWQSSPTYIASGLTPLTSYSFRTRARDSAAVPNLTGWSNTLAATTEAPPTDIEILGAWAGNTSHAKESGSNRALIFIAHAESTSAINLSSVTYGGQSMTKVVDLSYNAASGYAYATAFILKETGVAAATSGTFSLTWGGTSPGNSAYASAFFSNVDQTTSTGATGTGGSTSNPVTTTSSLATNDGDMVLLGATCGNSGLYTLNSGFIEGIDQQIGGTVTGVTGHKSATGAAETPSATYSSSINRQMIIGLVLKTGGTPITRTLTTSTGGNGTVTTPGIGTYSYSNGTNVSIVASANTNYHFVNWTGTAVTAGKVANTTSASTTVLMDADYTVQANFAIDQRSLTTTATTGGSVSTPGIGTYWYNHGTNTSIIASANAGYHFVNWTGTAVTAGKVAAPDSINTTVLMDANYSAQANFTIDQFTITSSAGSNGTIDPSGAIVKNYGSSQCWTATPGTGYAVDTWYLDGSPVQTGGNTYCLDNITANHTVTVTFKLLTYTITASAGSHGSVAPTSVMVNYGSNQDFTATPNGGYDVDQWSLDGSPVQTGGTTYTLSNITAAHTVSVTFKVITASFKISGYIRNGCSVAIEGVVVDADNGAGQDTTDSAGYYEIMVDNGWSGNVTPAKLNHTFVPASRSYANVQADAANQNYTATNVYDLNCDGLIGIGDIDVFVDYWLSTGAGIQADFTNNQNVDFLDYVEFATAWESK